MISSLDAARLAHPELGYAIYAYEPRGAVTLEIHDPAGEVFTFTAESEEAAFLLAFPADLVVGNDERHEAVSDIFD